MCCVHCHVQLFAAPWPDWWFIHTVLLMHFSSSLGKPLALKTRSIKDYHERENICPGRNRTPSFTPWFSKCLLGPFSDMSITLELDCDLVIKSGKKKKKTRHICNFKMSHRSPASTHLTGVLVQVTEVQRLHRGLAGRQWLGQVLAEWVALGSSRGLWHDSPLPGLWLPMAARSLWNGIYPSAEWARCSLS